MLYSLLLQSKGIILLGTFTRTIRVSVLKFCTPKFLNKKKMAYANSADPDQTAPKGAV